MLRNSLILVLALLASVASSQNTPKKYPWQHGDTSCNETMTFCWYGSELVSDPEVTANGNRWVAQDKEEKPFEWITRGPMCPKTAHLHSCSESKCDEWASD